jgi:myo-inositol-1(or 4)-monophosphatase
MTAERRHSFALRIARQAGELGLRHFRALDRLTIESKGHQDLVTNADREVETLIRKAIATEFPDDGIVGEEHGRTGGTSGHVWVIDPIDGTANFVAGIPAWCVSIACCRGGVAHTGVIFEPASGEMFSARRGAGACVNDRPMRASASGSLTKGSVGTGFSNRAEADNIVGVIGDLIASGGVFYRNASGALMLAYVAAGRLIGYVEEHMNAWDCLAGLLMVEEAGGRIAQPDPATAIDRGTVVIAGGAAVFPAIEAIARRRFRARSAIANPIS